MDPLTRLLSKDKLLVPSPQMLALREVAVKSKLAHSDMELITT